MARRHVAGGWFGWLKFKLLVIEGLGAEVAGEIDWHNPRLVCVAGDFMCYDEHAVRQINRSIELIRYHDFSGELLALELVTAVTDAPESEDAQGFPAKKPFLPGVNRYLEQSPIELKNLYAELEAYLMA